MLEQKGIVATFAHVTEGALVYVGGLPVVGTEAGVLVRADSPIRSIADLRGKRLALKKGSSEHDVAMNVLATAGLTPADVQQVFQQHQTLPRRSAPARSTLGRSTLLRHRAAERRQSDTDERGKRIYAVQPVDEHAIAQHQEIVDTFARLRIITARIDVRAAV